MKIALNFIVNPKRFFEEIISHKNEKIFLTYLMVCCLILSVCELKSDEINMDNGIISAIIILFIGLIKFPIMLYLVAFLISKFSHSRAKNRFAELLFRVVTYSLTPWLIAGLLNTFFPNSKFVSICLTLFAAWSFVLLAIGYSYVKRNSSVIEI